MAAELYESLKQYCGGAAYPFHMPGHKRNPAFRETLPGSGIDITEIGGFDNLHHAEGIIREAQERAARIYGVKKTFFSVNGSTAALLAAVSAAVPAGGKILLARNCHKAVYHAVYLRNLTPVYVCPQWAQECGLNGGILPADIEEILKREEGIGAVLLTSPTYDGIVSDIGAVAEIVHRYEIPLIVDEAHGAHFPFSSYFPDSAIARGADVVIHSVHKTLPSLTQTALLHQVTDRVEERLLTRYMGIYQTSSPSYHLMASIDSCMDFLERAAAEPSDTGKDPFLSYTAHLQTVRERLSRLNHIRVPGRELTGRCGIFDMDLSKIVLSVQDAAITGPQLHDRLRRYNLEMEMEAASYVLALSSVGDTAEGLERLTAALEEIDGELTEREGENLPLPAPPLLQQVLAPFQAVDADPSVLSAAGLSADLLYLYPPGIPLAVPGERLTGELLEYLRLCEKAGLEILRS